MNLTLLAYRINSFLNYKIKAKSPNSVHSPFVYKLYTEIIRDKSHYPEYDEFDKLEEYFINNQRSIEVTAFNNEYSKNEKLYKNKFCKVSEIYKRTSITKKYARLIFRLVRHFNPQNVLEIGTGLGISTSYIAKGNPNSEIVTLEGCSSKSQLAQASFDRSGIINATIKIGNFNITLDDAINHFENIDFAYVDGNHTKRAVLEYFEKIYKKSTSQTIIIFDDIRWSREMEDAWNILAADPRVSVSIDLVRIGIVFLKKDIEKQHFILSF